jgi:hypothetical protein
MWLRLLIKYQNWTLVKVSIMDLLDIKIIATPVNEIYLFLLNFIIGVVKTHVQMTSDVQKMKRGVNELIAGGGGVRF